LKKAVGFLLILCCIIPASAFAVNNFYFDVGGTLLQNKDAKFNYGAAWGFGYNLVDKFNIVYHGAFAFAKTDPGETTEFSAQYISQGLGLEYVWYLWKRLGWRSSLLIGVVMLDISEPNLTVLEDYNSLGVGMGLNTGVQWDVTQHVTPFFDVGFHYDYMFSKREYTATTALQQVNVYGITLQLGIRFVFGRNKSIDSEY
jgi:long-subunit fatty acid transport protein